MSDDVRHLGTIEGHEIPSPDAGAPPPPPAAPHVPPPAPPSPSSGPAPAAPASPAAPTGPPPAPPAGPPSAQPPAVPAVADRMGQVKGEAVEAWHDIREAHRRGPKPNSRPLPRWVERLAYVLDDSIPVPGTGGRRIGVDGILALIPGIGDAAGFALSMVVVAAGLAAGVSFPTLLRMMVNVGFESLVGLIPFGGALFDMAYKANNRNVRLIEKDLADRRATRRSSLTIIVLLVLMAFVSFLMMVVLAGLGLAVFAWFLYRLFG